ncbi:ferredoxin [Streptomyces sp. NPDC012769]|uniref:ferredoxin n=1 Tax=Streptomyces sp. NPDC012769 TaxID=3364848 RepID=UPI0036AB63B0
MCAMTAPEVFDQDPDDGLVLLLHAEPPATHRPAARMAVGLCPSAALAVHEPEPDGSKPPGRPQPAPEPPAARRAPRVSEGPRPPSGNQAGSEARRHDAGKARETYRDPRGGAEFTPSSGKSPRYLLPGSAMGPPVLVGHGWCHRVRRHRRPADEGLEHRLHPSRKSSP